MIGKSCYVHPNVGVSTSIKIMQICQCKWQNKALWAPTHSIETREKLIKIVQINFLPSLENSERFTATE